MLIIPYLTKVRIIFDLLIGIVLKIKRLNIQSSKTASIF
nr:MAG TPA: hypothetical protein [Caudoviricetes sp.]